jgi:acyl-CoA synthetase (AMP-forming)/AMP-acid ligase II
MPTSSTTGASKIVPHSIDMILANVDSVVNHHDLNRNSVIMTCLPMFHVNALYFSFLSVFLVGGELVLHKMYDIRGMINSIEHYKVSIFSLIPSVVANITRNFDLLNVKNLNNLKYIVSAAAPLSKDLLINFYKLTSKQIIQGYGLSEAINFSCITPRDLSQDEYLYIMTNFKVPTIGIALKCNTIDIIKENNELASEGEVGEFYIGGKNVFDGYLNDEKILRKKDNKIPTGDLGFWRMFKNEKYFFVTSRKKEVAKINGESVSLRDLDEHYCNDLEIDSYTITFKNKYLGEAIGAVAVNNLSELDVKKLISHLMLKNGDRPNSQRVKALILVSKESFRTVSGKAKRWSFESKCLPLESVVLDDRIKVLI